MMVIEPDWPAPPQVRALSTTRQGGQSLGVYARLNLSAHVADVAELVDNNRRFLVQHNALPEEPRWLNQVHGVSLVNAQEVGEPVNADASITRTRGIVCAVLTADCLPILMCDHPGTMVAAVHGGWRGLAGGILEVVVAAFRRQGIGPEAIMAWLGPAISGPCYEVDDAVKEVLTRQLDQAALTPNDNHRWQLDIYELARGRLRSSGVEAIFGGTHCTFTDSERFFSYRRDGVCGRQATLIWLADH